jgi:hypothetical protein
MARIRQGKRGMRVMEHLETAILVLSGTKTRTTRTTITIAKVGSPKMGRGQSLSKPDYGALDGGAHFVDYLFRVK